ncbi:AmpG family muropeptide MFS transporter [Pelagibius sp. Alg239-R121]|uniref:AmpG family muropeptide MFS transporter n=1 Tax=Pelagibius sp. Alg239-R121 TaxID=2993448 RepID=UPI0024A6A5FC|nr:AmpG family muropeptide MFS transporter [Pelagibius sp. Alg239-R121]
MPAEADPPLDSTPVRRSWAGALAVYRHPRVLGMLFLGFSAGLPFLLLFSTLSFWLSEVGVSVTTIGLFSWVGLTFSIKVFWAPVVDRLAIPPFTTLLGKRRGWMLLAQIGIAAGLLGIANSDPLQNLEVIVYFALLVAFASATQDIAIDAYRIEAVEQSLQGAMSGTYQVGYRIGLIAAGAGALYIAAFSSWPIAYMTMAALVGIGMVTVLIIREPEVVRDQATLLREAELLRQIEGSGSREGSIHRLIAWFSGAVVSPLVDFFARNGKFALVILAFVGLYRLSDITLGVMANPFYNEIGFTKIEIANVAKIYGVLATLVGALVGGILVVRIGLLKSLLIGALMVAGTNLLFALLAVVGPDIKMLAVAISADNISGGLAGSVFIAYLSSLTNTAYTATQYALFSSLFTLPGKLVAGGSGFVVESAGYVNFFFYASALGIPAILLVLYLMYHERRMEQSASPARDRS